jgi:F-type H+-transporting ATPase subunit b
MAAVSHLPIASSSGSFLITPNVGLMIWTLLLFGISLYILWKLAFPRISEALDRRQHAIEESIDHADQVRKQADDLLAEYQQRLRDAREQAEQIVERSRKTAEAREREVQAEAQERREQMMEQTRREVADLTVLATEKITRKVLDEDDQRRLVEDALADLDFSVLAPGDRN